MLETAGRDEGRIRPPFSASGLRRSATPWALLGLAVAFVFVSGLVIPDLSSSGPRGRSWPSSSTEAAGPARRG